MLNRRPQHSTSRQSFDNKTKLSIIPAHGERALIIGQTGSGKTNLAAFLLSYMPDTIIYDTKEEPKFKSLTSVTAKSTLAAIDIFRKDHKREVTHVVVKPSILTTQDPTKLDLLLSDHYQNGRNLTAYLDEAYQYHIGGRAGPGLLSLLTRGRSRGETLVMCTQRPAWLSRFCLTESQRFYVFNVVDKRDWKTLGEVIPNIDTMGRPPKYHFYYFDYSMDAPVLFKPAPKVPDSGYTDEAESGRKWF